MFLDSFLFRSIFSAFCFCAILSIWSSLCVGEVSQTAGGAASSPAAASDRESDSGTDRVLPCSETSAASPVPLSVSPKVLADWEMQERMALRFLGSRESLKALVETAEKLKRDLSLPENSPHSAAFQTALNEAGESLRREGLAEFYPQNFRFSESLFFHSTLPPTADPEKTFPRVTAKPSGKYDFRAMYPYADGTLYRETWCRTGQTVTYCVEGMEKSKKYVLRLLFTSDFKRTQPVLINGEEVDVVNVPAMTAFERFYPLEGLTDAEIEIRHTTGPNVTVAQADLLCAEMPAEEKKAELSDRLTRKPIPLFRSEWIRLRNAMREVLFAQEELDFDELLFVKRHWPQGNHQCGHRVGENQTAGADLMILKGLSPDGEVRGLLPPELAEKCGIGRPDLSFDGKKIVFPLAWPRNPPTRYPWAGGHAFYDPSDPTDMTHYHGGATLPYDVFVINADGTGLKNLTDLPDIEDSEPCWLPDGRIVFTSCRGGRVVQCGDWSPVFGLHVMNGDGSDPHPISQPQDTEFYPALLEDGRILFTRWDYVMKPYNTMQEVWAVNPDGTRSMKIYGDWYKFSRGPIAMQEARQIPGTRKLAAVGCAHHNSGVGPLLTVDLSLNRLGPAGMKLLTPEIAYPEIRGMDDEREDPNFNDLEQAPKQAGWFTSPWPLSEKLFLCVYSPGSDNLDDTYGIYLLTDFGFKELIYRFDDTSCYCPIPLKPRPKPPVAADMERLPEGTPGTLLLQDVYRGLEGIPRGTVKWLRVCETYPKCRHTNPHRVGLGVDSGWDMRGVLGYVPVAEDGSAAFEVPSDRMIFLEALDEDFLEVQRMRNYLTLRPGEVQGCIGCHESPLDVSPVSRTTLGPRVPEKLQPPPYGAGPMHFERVIQPILDAKCVSCHDGTQAEAQVSLPDLRGGTRVTAPGTDRDEGPQHLVSTSFLALVPKHVSYYPVSSNQGKKTFQPPRSVGSFTSPLMHRLKETQCGKKLAPEEWRAFAAWIDLNAPYYGSYDDDFLTP